jgi:hypothetical protein
MVPGAAHSIADQQTLGQRPAVMGAGCADRQQVGTTPHQQDRFVSNVPDQHLAICQPNQRDPPGEVRALRL